MALDVATLDGAKKSMLEPKNQRGSPEDVTLYNPMEWATIALRAPDLATAWKAAERRLTAGGLDSPAYLFDLPFGDIEFPDPDSIAGVLISREFETMMRDDPQLSEGVTTNKKLAAGDSFIPTIPGHPDSPAVDFDQTAWEIMTSFGFKGGFRASFHDRYRARYSMFLTCSLKSTKEISEIYDNFGSHLRNAMIFFNEGMVLRKLKANQELPALSPRERECLLWVSVGRTTQQIADQLNLTDSTIDEYIANAMRKLNASSRAHACARSVLLSLISP